jgi:hypothetical protein
MGDCGKALGGLSVRGFSIMSALEKLSATRVFGVVLVYCKTQLSPAKTVFAGY